MKDWSQGRILTTPETQLLPHKDYVRLEEQEQREVYRNFTALDDGRSRERLAEFKYPEDARRCVEAVNATRWRYPADEPFPTDSTLYPIQIYGPDFSGVSIAWCNNPSELDGATMWCPMAPLPEAKS